jgi:hypothetical protein
MSMRLSWVEFILRLIFSRPVRLGIGLPFGVYDQILSFSFLWWQLLCCFSCRAPSLTRGRVCNLQCNCWLVRSLRTNNHTLPSHLRLCSLFIASYDSQGLRWRYSNLPLHGVVYVSGVGVHLAADGQSTSSSLVLSLPWDPWPDVLFFFLIWQLRSSCS